MSSRIEDMENDVVESKSDTQISTLWSRLRKALNSVEEHIADFFGLNDSKYQWALDEYVEQRLSGDTELKCITVGSSEDEAVMQPSEAQTMDRDTIQEKLDIV